MSLNNFKLLMDCHKQYEGTIVASVNKSCGAHGDTYEQVILDKKVDNLAKSDFGDIEIKCKTKKGLAPRIRQFNVACGEEQRLLNDYGLIGKDGKRRLGRQIRVGGRGTLDGKIQPDIIVGDTHLAVTTGSLRLEWSNEEIWDRLVNKVPNISIISAQRHLDDANNIGWSFPEMRYYHGLNPLMFFHYLQSGVISIEFRIAEDHDHGTCFNISEKNLAYMYEQQFVFVSQLAGRRWIYPQEMKLAA